MTNIAAVVRFVHLTAAVLLAGSFSFTLLIARPAFLSAGADYLPLAKSQSRIARWCWLAVFTSALLGLWAQTLAVGKPGASFDFPAILTLLGETHYGKVWSARMILALVFPILFWFGSKRGEKDLIALLAIGFFLSAILLASLALAGHTAAAEGGAFIGQVAVDALHLFATGVWLGGLLPLAMLLRQDDRKADPLGLAVASRATKRFSLLAVVSVAALILTGAYNAWVLVGGFPPLFGTEYGRLLLLKISLLLPLIAIAALNLLKLKPKLIETASMPSKNGSAILKRLSRNVAVEAFLGLGILLIVGHMGITPPARHVQPDWPFASRWDWTVLENAPKARAEVQRGFVWVGIGGIVLITALARRRRRTLTALIGLGALAYAGRVITDAVSTDAYPTTYKRPAVVYQAISVANGRYLYDDSGCAACHGIAGYGDGSLADELDPKPADLTAPHANTHTAGDLFWWLSHGVNNTSMPGFSQSLSEEARWDLINFMRALSSGDRARALAPVIENEPWLVAPDFSYVTNSGEAKTLRDHRGGKIVLLVLLDVKSTEQRLKELADVLPALQSAQVEIIVVPNIVDLLNLTDRLPGLVASEGVREISETYKLFARSFADESLVTGPRHVEFLIDKQGYIRARWLPAENDAWRKTDALLKQVELLGNEKPRAPAPDEHVH